MTSLKTSLTTILRRLASLEWLALMGAAPLLIFPTVRPTWTAAALALLAALWLLRWAALREPWPLTPFNGALLLFAVMLPVTLWATAFPDITRPEVIRVVLGLAAFRAVALAVRERRSLRLALAVFCLVGLVLMTVGLTGMQWAAKVGFLEALGSRIPQLSSALPEDQAAPGINPNHLAGGLVLYLPLAFALVAGWRPARRAMLRGSLVLAGSAAFLALVGGVLVLTQSRSGWLGGAAGVLALGTLWGLSRRERWARALGAALPLLALAAAVAGLLAIGPARVGEMLYGAAEGSLDTAAGTVSMQGRIEIWSRALYGIQDFAFTGCGMGTFRRVVHILYPLFLIGPDNDIGHAHNIFLQTALDLGLPGLVAYLALLGVALAVCWRVALPSPLPPHPPFPSPPGGRGEGGRRGDGVRALSLGLAAGLVGLHVYGLTDALALGTKPAVVFWLALGLVAALPHVAALEAGREREGRVRRPRRVRLSTPQWSAVAVLLFLGLLLVLAAAVLGYRALQGGAVLPGQPSIRLPIYPAAQALDVRSESPPADSGWVGLLEVATFTTTQPLTDVVAFYQGVLAEGGWEVEVEAGDAASWGGITTQEGGRSVCLLNAFAFEGEVWVSLVCGDKSEPVDLPPLSVLPTPTP